MTTHTTSTDQSVLRQCWHHSASEGRMKSWSMADIKENADMAETWPGSGILNWGEIGWGALSAWVTLSVEIGGDATLPEYDVESVKSMFEEWWRSAKAWNTERHAPSGAR